MFESYEDIVWEYLTDVRNSDALQNVHKDWPPTVGQVRDACSHRQEHVERVRKAQNSPKPQLNRPYNPPDRTPGCRANVMVPKDNDKYAALCQWAKTADECDYEFTDRGIRVALSVWEDRMGVILASRWRSLSDADLRAQYGRDEAEDSKAAR